MEQSVFESLSAKASETARRVALDICANEADAEDVVQDVMLKLWTMRAHIAGGTEMLRLAKVIGQREAIDVWRYNQRMEPMDKVREPARLAISPQEEMELQEDVQCFLQRMEKLPPAEYQILRMRHVEQLNNMEIANILQIKPASVATLLARARHKMLEQMKQNR